VSDINIYDVGWDMELPHAAVRLRLKRLGPKAGARELGVSLYEIDPGGAVSPYHVQHGNEELLLVLDGTPQLRTPAGTRTLRAGDLVVFPRGQDGAHRIANAGPELARVLVFSTMNFPEVAEYVDAGTVLAIRGRRDGLTFPAHSDTDFQDAWLSAMEAEASGDES
jgi:uncharacterized cupin superfamily protein